jgi:hypothetical protein
VIRSSERERDRERESRVNTMVYTMHGIYLGKQAVPADFVPKSGGFCESANTRNPPNFDGQPDFMNLFCGPLDC